MENLTGLNAAILHSSVNTTIMLVDVMVIKEILSPSEGATMLKQYADRLSDDAAKVGASNVLFPFIQLAHNKIAQLNSLQHHG